MSFIVTLLLSVILYVYIYIERERGTGNPLQNASYCHVYSMAQLQKNKDEHK